MSLLTRTLFVAACLLLSATTYAKSMMIQVKLVNNTPVVEKTWIVDRNPKQAPALRKNVPSLEITALDARNRVLWVREIEDELHNQKEDAHSEDHLLPDHFVWRVPYSKRIEQVVIRRKLPSGIYDPASTKPLLVVTPPVD